MWVNSTFYCLLAKMDVEYLNYLLTKWHIITALKTIYGLLTFILGNIFIETADIYKQSHADITNPHQPC